MTTALQVIDQTHARVLINFLGTATEMPDPVDREATDAAVRAMVTEAIESGSIPGIAAQQADLRDFVIDRFPPTEERAYALLMMRPKTPFGA